MKPGDGYEIKLTVAAWRVAAAIVVLADGCVARGAWQGRACRNCWCLWTVGLYLWTVDGLSVLCVARRVIASGSNRAARPLLGAADGGPWSDVTAGGE